MSALNLRPTRGACLPLAAAISLCLATAAHAQSADTSPTTLDSIQVSSSWLGTGLHDSVKSFAGARTVVDRQQIQASGAASVGDAMRRIPGVQVTDNSGTAGSSVSLNIGVRGLTGRYSPRSTVLLDGVPLAVAPYGQPQLSFSPVSLSNIESIDVVRGGGAVRYGPQNVGGIINFSTRAIPTEPGLHGEASARYTGYDHGGGDNTQYSAFLGGTASNGLGAALLYSGQDGTGWRKGSDDRFNDLALKFAYALDERQELRAKLSYYDVRSLTPGGLNRAQFEADPFQNTRPSDFWKGHRAGIDLGYTNSLSDTREFEVLAYYNESTRASQLVNDARTQDTVQPRDYRVLGIEPRFTQRLQWGPSVHDVTVGYRFLRERGNDRSYTVNRRTGVPSATTRFDNATDAHSLYIDDRIALGKWRITPGVRQEWIDMDRQQAGGTATFSSRNNKALPSLNVSYLLTPQLTVFGNYTTSFGPVQNIQLNSQSATNPLNPEVAKTTELGARWQDGALRAEVTVFKMRFDNQILQVPGVTPPTFRNIGATDHKGVESALEYHFAEDSALAGLELYANYTWTKAIQQSGDNRGLDVPFYSRDTDSIGARYTLATWTFNVSSTHQSGQFADAANTWVETPDARVGRVPGVRLVNAQVSWELPWQSGTELTLGVNNLADKRWYTRNVDGNAGRMVGAPRTFYVQGRYRF
ncbi:TonB-dependent siderophore receptor [Stenotrophomonas sp. 24(2023)]|uniref:TonB-dependent receptor family protein n=1 Tax=Stenotrophomonas sp. 24(2023) TaxID=3068324 RepID=UPI0027DEDDB4|nr:TonB-dependent siderophore receptor [Stenotrophomonas sp. 24(2023)]WMJ69481.1 TonB-dependent siderophore receptor [Stenotrophomonas sp. 24(2023)]